MAASSLLLFGPVSPKPTPTYLARLRTSIEERTDLNFVRGLIKGLPGLWPVIVHACPQLNPIAGSEQLEQLNQFLTSETSLDTEALSNLIAAPLTIISQISEVLSQDRDRKDASLPSLENVQGFCLGFLTAAAFASSRDMTDFRHYASVAVRLAVCIGAVVDLDEASHDDPSGRHSSIAVRWKASTGNDDLVKVLKDYPQAYISCVTDEDSVTVTLPSQKKASFAKRLTEAGILTHSIGLRGRYHHQDHTLTARQLKKLCRHDSRFKFPAADRLVLPLRSNSDSRLIAGGVLHDIALHSILTEQSEWFHTVKAAVGALGGDRIQIKSVGAGSFSPRSLLHSSAAVPKHEKGLLAESHCSSDDTDSESSGHSFSVRRQLDLSTESSSNPTPCTESDQDTADEPVDAATHIAVVGMACRFPEADTLEQFWQMIASGKNAVGPIPRERFNPQELHRDPKGPFWGNFLRDPDAFDHRFFSISGREAKSMDPQQRLLLQVVYEAMESSGYYGLRQGTKPNNIGCYVGVGSVDYEDNVCSENATAFSALGTLRAFISGRVSHYFGWSGPSITYDTACSSSAVAIHSACKAIQSGDCSMAVAGGVNVITSPKLFQNLAAGGFLNSTGASKAFDSGANGYCRGEGAGVVVLKPLQRAIADCDSIIGVIGGSAVNQGSNCTPITVPATNSQSALYHQALSSASVKPGQVSYVEAHGTGTPVGDPIELESIRQTFGGSSRDEQLFVGSVKDNIGHAEAASGAAGLIKTLLMMQNQAIPKQANFVSLNPAIGPLEKDNMNIPTRTQPWTTQTRKAVVNNYGAAGSNAAIVVYDQVASKDERATLHEPLSPQYTRAFPITVMAKSTESLRAYCAALKSFVATSCEGYGEKLLPLIAYNLAKKQNRRLEFSLNFAASSISNLNDQLETLAVASNRLKKAADHARPVVLCFGGQNGRRVNLSQDLFQSSKVLRQHIIRCDSVCRALNLPSILPSIFKSEAVDDIVELHCKLFALQYACAMSWIDCGLRVDTLIGHSFGQLTALCVANSLSLDDGLRLIATRARLIRDQWGPESGAMIAVEGDLETVEDRLDKVWKRSPSHFLEISCYNGPRSFVLAGTQASIEAFEDVATSGSAPVKIQRLGNTHAFHSPLVECILPEFEKLAKSIRFRTPSIHVETCSSGQNWVEINAGEVARHSRTPVYFTDAVQRIEKRLQSCIWLEAGSGSPVIAMTRRILQADESAMHTLLPTELGSPTAQSSLAKATSELWGAGCEVQFWPFHQSQHGSYAWLNLPPYQFEKTRHWMELKQTNNTKAEVISAPTPTKPELLQKLDSDKAQNLFAIDRTHGIFDLCTRGHAVLNHSLCPASMYFELAMRAARVEAGPASDSKRVPHVHGLEISSPLSTSPKGNVFLRMIEDTTQKDTWRFSIFSCSQPDAADTTTHASGTVAMQSRGSEETNSGFQSLKRLVGPARCEPILKAPAANGLNGSIVYKNFGRVVDYAAYYRGVTKVLAKDLEAVGHVSVPEEQPRELEPGCCDPVAIDNFLQVSGIHINCLWNCKDDEVFVCTAIRDFSLSEQYLHKPSEKRSWTVYSNSEAKSKGQVVNDIFVLDSETGELVLTILGAKFTSLPLKSLSKTLSKLNASQEHAPLHEHTERKDAGHIQQDEQQQPDDTQTLVDEDDTGSCDTASVSEDDDTDQGHVLTKLQAMLSEVLEVPVDDVQPDAGLADLGIDSLMATEVMSEIKGRFAVDISNAEFQDLTDIRSLRSRIQPPTSESTSKQKGATEKAQTSNFASSTPEGEPVSNQDPKAILPSSGSAIALSSKDCFGNAKSGYDAAATRTGFAGFSQDVYPLQKKLVVAYVVEAFTNLGCSLGSLEPGQRLPDIRFSPKHSKVMNQYYNILEDAKLITRTETDSYRTSEEVPRESAQSLHDEAIKKFPQHVSEHSLLHATGPKLANCLTGRDDPIALLFGSAAARALMTDVYTNAPMFKAGTQVLAEYLSDIFRQCENDDEIRILELGAGTGGTTSYLIESLLQCRRKFRYTFTDLSSSLVAAAKKKFKQYDFMEYATLDIEQEPPKQHQGRYDIILSTNCIHATKNLEVSTTNIRKMLQPDGLLCLVELTRNLFWFDLVFGLLEGWWLFNDGRKHALANEHLWEQDLHRAGFQWVDWTENRSPESQILRLIAASPSKTISSMRDPLPTLESATLPTQETVAFKQEGSTQLLADIYYPKQRDGADEIRPVALMIHGGGHVMLSRKDVRPQQTQTLLDAGFLPVSVDYRLCPEITLADGPVRDVCSALAWARHSLPSSTLKRPDIRPDGSRVVAVGWSTGGHLAMTLAWTAPAAGIAAPDAILAFYCPTDYEDPFWTRPNIPRGSERQASEASYDLWEGVHDAPITGYNPPASTRALGGWMAPEDPRSRICLHMNWKGATLPVLLNGMDPARRRRRSQDHLPSPTREQIAAVSPLAQIRKGSYRTPTFLVHGTRDDLIPWEQAQRTVDAMRERGVAAEVRVVQGAVHLFDV
ncbi:MAG: hypothetical protein Q9210_003192, partial [Variospora velana]